MSSKITTYILLFLAGIGYSSGQVTDSLKQVLEKTEGSQRIDILHQLILSVWLNYPEQGLLYGQEALALSKELNDSTVISKSLRLLAGVHYYKGDYDKSLNYNLLALQIAEKIQDSLLINNGYNNIGLLYYNLGGYQTSLEFLLRAKDIKERIKETYGLAALLNNIGLVYERILDFDKARTYFFEALTFSKAHSNNDQIIYSQNNIGITFLSEKNLVEAKLYFNKSLKLAEQIGNINWGAVSLRGIGEVLVNKEMYDSATYYYQKALIASKGIDDKKGLSEVYYLFSEVEFLKGHSKLAINYLKKGDKIAKKIGLRQQLLKNLHLYIKIYKAANNKDEIIAYQEAYLHLKDSLFQDIVTRNLNLIPIKIQEEEDRLKVVNQQAEIKSKDLTNTILIWMLIFATPLIIILILLIRRNVSTNKKLTTYNKEVLTQKEKIESQKKVLETKNLELEKAKHLIGEQKKALEVLNVDLSQTVDKRTSELKNVNEELRVTNLEMDNFIYKSSHDIRGPLLRLIGVCSLALMEVKEKKAVEYLKMIDKASKRLNNTFDKLKIVTELNLKEIITERIDFLLIIKQNLIQNKYIEGLEEVAIDTEIEEGLSFYSDPAILDLIIFNMIQNAVQLLKVSEVKSKKLKIGIKIDDDFLIMNFDIKNIDSFIRKSDGFYAMIGKDDEVNQSFGIGLYTVKQCVKKIGGKLLFLGDEQQTTRFTITIPTNH